MATGLRVDHLVRWTRSPRSTLLPVFGWEGSPTKIDYRKEGALILTSLLEDLVDCLRLRGGSVLSLHRGHVTRG